MLSAGFLPAALLQRATRAHRGTLDLSLAEAGTEPERGCRPDSSRSSREGARSGRTVAGV